MQLDSFEVVVVGAGFFGAVIAEQAASRLGRSVCVLDRRPHIGGNAYSEVDSDSGVEVHRYGTHIFHTNSETVWRYMQRFTYFTDYRHRVFTVANGRVYSMPINLATVCAAFGRIMSPDEARAVIAAEAAAHGAGGIGNLEDKAIASVGRTLYDLLIRGYTQKQWQTDPRELSADIIGRLPVRFSFDDRYFADRYEGMPVDGYTAIFQRMLEHPKIAVELGVDYFDVAERITPRQLVIYTGPIDRFFGYACGHLAGAPSTSRAKSMTSPISRAPPSSTMPTPRCRSQGSTSSGICIRSAPIPARGPRSTGNIPASPAATTSRIIRSTPPPTAPCSRPITP